MFWAMLTIWPVPGWTETIDAPPLVRVSASRCVDLLLCDVLGGGIEGGLDGEATTLDALDALFRGVTVRRVVEEQVEHVVTEVRSHGGIRAALASRGDLRGDRSGDSFFVLCLSDLPPG